MVRLAMEVLPEPNPNSFGFGNQGRSLREVLDEGTSRRQSIAEIIKAKSGQPEQRGASHDGRSAKDQLRCSLDESSVGNPDGLKD